MFSLRTLGILALLSACSSGFQVPPRPDMRVELDLASSTQTTNFDMTCFNTACGGCSQWARPDGTPAQAGDPCLWNGVLQCSATGLTCTSTQCIACPGFTVVGTVCGADGHSIIELLRTGMSCSAYDIGSAIGQCNRNATDHCLHKCVQDGATMRCAAQCSETDAGVQGCPRVSTPTCTDLQGC